MSFHENIYNHIYTDHNYICTGHIVHKTYDAWVNQVHIKSKIHIHIHVLSMSKFCKTTARIIFISRTIYQLLYPLGRVLYTRVYTPNPPFTLGTYTRRHTPNPLPLRRHIPLYHVDFILRCTLNLSFTSGTYTRRHTPNSPFTSGTYTNRHTPNPSFSLGTYILVWWLSILILSRCETTNHVWYLFMSCPMQIN